MSAVAHEWVIKAEGDYQTAQREYDAEDAALAISICERLRPPLLSLLSADEPPLSPTEDRPL